MSKIKKKGTEGTAVTYITKDRAIKKLQLSPGDFRRLCILKGIYPRDPPHKNKIASSAKRSTIYLKKDIQFLSHEPLLAKFRELRTFHRRLRKYAGKKEWVKVRSFEKNSKPIIKLDHLIRERYPSFLDALRDLDDPLSMLALFASLPRTDAESHQAETSYQCMKLLREFEAYVIATGSLKKAFVSIKGIYYQAEILGQTVTWIVPHEFTTPIPAEVDFKVMLTFLEFYLTLMRFVNFRLFSRLGWEYSNNFIQDGQQVILASTLPPIAQPEEVFPNGDVRLLEGAKIFVSREVPIRAMTFVLQCMGATVSFANGDDPVAIAEDDPSLTHQIVDRPSLPRMFVGRHYLQPQWAFDSLNMKYLMDMTNYRIGATLPPHPSPFVIADDDDDDDDDDNDGGKDTLSFGAGKEGNNDNAKVETSETFDNKVVVVVAKGKKQKVDNEQAQKELGVAMLSKKRQKLYQEMQLSRQKVLEEKKNLKAKRDKIAKKNLATISTNN